MEENKIIKSITTPLTAKDKEYLEIRNNKILSEEMNIFLLKSEREYFCKDLKKQYNLEDDENGSWKLELSKFEFFYEEKQKEKNV